MDKAELKMLLFSLPTQRNQNVSESTLFFAGKHKCLKNLLLEGNELRSLPPELGKGVATPETNWNSSRIEWTNCHTLQWQIVFSTGDKFQFVSRMDGP